MKNSVMINKNKLEKIFNYLTNSKFIDDHEKWLI